MKAATPLLTVTVIFRLPFIRLLASHILIYAPTVFDGRFEMSKSAVTYTTPTVLIGVDVVSSSSVAVRPLLVLLHSAETGNV